MLTGHLPAALLPATGQLVTPSGHSRRPAIRSAPLCLRLHTLCVVEQLGRHVPQGFAANGSSNT